MDHKDVSAEENLEQKFLDLDDGAGFETCSKELRKAETRNFVVEFSDTCSRCATDLKTTEIKTLLKAPRSPNAETRWINFWGGDLERDSIEAIVTHYGLSPRLINLLCSKASDKYTQIYTKVPKAESREPQPGLMHLKSHKTVKDAEKANYSAARLSSDIIERPPIDMQKTHFGEIVDDIWHFCSVDWGYGYLYVGYNSLFSVPDLEVDSGPDKPTGKRIWTSLVLCADGTVISVSEKAFPRSKVYPEILTVVRRNVFNVFHHLSKISKTTGRQNDLMTISLRSFDTNAPESETSDPQEKSSLLFYYLFDDWITSYSLAARREHPYGDKLESLRRQMFETADIELVESLHRIGRQIAVLRRIYQSFELIIKRILQRQQLLSGGGRRETKWNPPFEVTPNSHNGLFPSLDRSLSMLPTMESQAIGVILSDSAIFRFERLLDRIGLYALSRIDEYLAEKDTLVTMNFNLIALKDSQATEKLTRVTVLLSKIAAIFLPLSLMTGYFSTQIQDLQNIYTAKTYWICFLVITILSLSFLVIFGLASDTAEGKTIYRSLTKIFWKKAKEKKLASKEK